MMKQIRIAQLAAVVVTFAQVSCETVATLPASADGVTTYDELVAGSGAAAGELVRAEVSCRVVVDGGTEGLPPVVVRPGRPAKASRVEVVAFPSHYSFPQTLPVRPGGAQAAGSFPVTPSAPTAFEEVETGWFLELAGEESGSYVLLRGTLTRVRAGEKVGAAGTPYQPIVATGRSAFGRDVQVVMSDNRAERPALVTEEFPVLVAAGEDGTYRVDLDPAGLAYAEFDCKIVRR